MGGAGIGLALVADLVHAHDGQVALTSTPAVGSTFTVTIPQSHRAPVNPDIPADRADQSADGRPNRGGAPIDSPLAVAVGAADGAGRRDLSVDGTARPPERSRVMVVEDDADLRTYLTRLLTADGWDVTAVADVETAMAAVLADNGSAATDLVLTDVMLPGRSGLHLVADLRAIDATGRLPILVLTARGGADAAAEGLAAGADDYITKPFSSHELLARVRANIELHHLRETAIDDADHRTRQVRDALDSNRTIGTAIGVLMATHRLTAQQASKSWSRPARTTTASSATSPPSSRPPGNSRSGPPTSTTSSSRPPVVPPVSDGRRPVCGVHSE